MVQHKHSMCHCDSVASLPGAAEGLEEQELARMQAAVHQLLVGVGEDPEREGLVDTPRRVAKAWLDMTRGYRQECKSAFGTALFHEPIVAAGSDGLVVVRDITFAALSERSLLPFHGRAHIAYVPSQGVVLGLSKLARVIKCLAARLQTQAQFTQRLVEAVQAEVGARGVAAVVQALHLGAGPAPAAQLTSAATGCFTQPGCGHLAEFLALLRLSGRSAPPAAGFCDAAAALERQQSGEADGYGAAVAAEAAPVASSSMVAATQQLLLSVGEDPARKGLNGGAARYASWLLSATAGYRMHPPSCCAGAACAGGCSGIGSPVAAAELGPPTPDEHSPDPSDASSDDMSTEVPFILGMREAEAAAAAAAGQPPELAQQAQRPAQQDGVQTFSAHFSSQCEHHLLPFYGTLRLAYLPGGAGSASAACDPACLRRRLAGVVEMFSRRLQVQERLTHQVADAVASLLGARAVLVAVESAHMCMVARGVEKHASTTLTTAARGEWAEDAAGRAAALEALLEPLQHAQR
ncbi:hypothetical protein ABPG75_004429 [Micractinium tetrahymenae]